MRKKKITYYVLRITFYIFYHKSKAVKRKKLLTGSEKNGILNFNHSEKLTQCMRR